jgi:hypothetical protein
VAEKKASLPRSAKRTGKDGKQRKERPRLR